MIQDLLHPLNLSPTRDERSRQEFTSSIRAHILVNMASTMNRRFDEKVKPRFVKNNGREPQNGSEVHKAMKDDLYFKFYSSARVNAQEMVWRSVIPVVERNLDQLKSQARTLKEDMSEVRGSVQLDASLQIPKNVSAIDVHLTPGGYHTEYTEDDVAAGAIYDNGLNVFAFNMMGKNLDDIGLSMSNFVRLKYPDFQPKKILDCGCTIGHNSVPWANTFPDAQVHAIDISAPLLRYANARSQSQKTAIQYSQMNATSLDFEDDSFDVVFSSMFLHELPLKDIHKFMAEAYRVLKPGGLLLNMELPPNEQMAPYDSFYLDWDCYYNQEPFYKCFRDQDYALLCRKAGFQDEKYVQFIMPQYSYMKDADFAEAISGKADIDDKTGRLTSGIQWFGFGAWK